MLHPKQHAKLQPFYLVVLCLTKLEWPSGIVVSCIPMGGPANSGRNVRYWDQALTAARSHGDLYLEALTIKNMGIAAMQEYGYATTMP